MEIIRTGIKNSPISFLFAWKNWAERQKLVLFRSITVLGIWLALVACGTEAPPEPPPPIEAAQVQPRLPADFVVCIDNSRSIKGAERVLIRETAMLLADLADPGDRLTVVTFGKDARLATSVVEIRSDKDRGKFKQQVQKKVKFDENFSDIRAGIRVLAKEEPTIFRSKGESIRAAILLTDGKLEPVARDAKKAFQHIQADLSGPLAATDLYAVVLGDTSSQHPIPGLPEMTGQHLMREHIARSADRYFHAKSLDQLLEIAVLILKRTKGISDFGEKGKTQFKIDNTVESMTVIVRKRAADGSRIADTSEIFLGQPETRKEDASRHLTYQNHNRTPGVSAHWSPDFQNFDLIVVRNPQEGFWEVGLKNDKAPVVLTKIVTPIELRYDARDRYYLNEASTLRAWLFDKHSQDVWKHSTTIQAHLGLEVALADSKTYAPLELDPGSGQFFLTVPSELIHNLNLTGEPTVVTIELIAKKMLEGTTEDPWFIRRSVPFTIELIEPVIAWITTDSLLTKIPFISLSTTLGADMKAEVSDSLGFETPPKLTVALEKFDEDSKIYQPQSQRMVEGVPSPASLTYNAAFPLNETGSYRYQYVLDGSTKTGPFAIRSPWSTFSVRYGWEYLGGGLVVLLILLQVFSAKTATLKGQIAIQEPTFCSENVAPVRVYHSDRLQKRCNQGLGTNHAFSIQPNRFLFFRKRMKLTMQKGKGSIGFTQGRRVLNSQTLQAGGSVTLVPRPHELSFTNSEGKAIKIKVNLTV